MLLLFIRWVLPFVISDDEENRFSDFIYAVTEPLLDPVRSLLEKYGADQRFLDDASFLVLYLLLSLILFLLRIL